ncbi:hypothetical protein FRC01_006709 [Tulasnella sp. 417]|nr:hypothetical protein FRC01_006709 [Tulasnella sp. 417]
MASDSADPLPVSFGKAGKYLWGNIPAFDALNIAMNEGAAVKDQDLALCFAASGDLRNVIKTINGLPSDYTGKCTLVINDFHPLVAIRSIVVLCMLLSSGHSEEAAAEVALQLLYSSKLTSAQDSFLQLWIDLLEKMEQKRPPLCTSQLSFGSHCTLEWAYPSEVGALLAALRTPAYPTSKAEADRRRIMLAPERIDYRERYYASLRSRHRAGFAYQRQTGVLLPIGQPINSFSTANRLLYSEDGKWLLKDNASPAAAWSPLEVEAMRKRLNLPQEDYMGNLFFYVKDQLTEFAKRARRFKMFVFLSAVDLRVLPTFLDLGDMGNLRFDRVETSNVMDTVGPSAIISAWGPRLNRFNPSSTLIMYSMNWPFYVPGGMAECQGPNDLMKNFMELASYLGSREGARRAKLPSISLILNNLGAFFDTRPPFRRFLRLSGVTRACWSAEVRERKAPRIMPLRFGVRIEEFDSPKITISLEQFYFTGQYPDTRSARVLLTPGEFPQVTFSFQLGMSDS